MEVSIIYIITLGVLFFVLFYFKKTDKKMNMIVWIIYSFCILYFLNVFEALILSLINMKNTLLSFSFFNLSISFILYFINKKKYGEFKKQEYYLNKKELIISLIFIIICIVFGFFRFSGFSSINYRISDATVHFKMSKDYSQYMKLFDSGFKDVFYKFDNSMFGYYIPCGLFMKIMPFMETVSYNIFNTLFLCLMGLCFYATLLTIKKGDKHNVFTTLMLVLYVLAYPLNYFLFGFGYLGPGILACNLILLTWEFISKYKKKYLYGLLLLFNFGLFVSYYLFAPAVFLSQGLYMLYLFMKGKYNLKQLFVYGIICLLIPTIFGFMYFIMSTKGTTSSAISSYSIDGYSYMNLIGNYILLIPLVCYSMYVQIKNKKVKFDFVFLICEVVYIIFTFFLIGGKTVSPYYFYKSYFILWICVNVLVFKLVNYDEYRVILRINYVLLLVAIMFSVFDVEKMVSKKNNSFNYSGSIHQLGDIYAFNVDMISNDYKISKDEILFLKSGSKYSKECKLSKGKRLPFLGYYLKRRWLYTLDTYIPALKYKKNDMNDAFTSLVDYDEFKNDDEVKCLMISDEFIKESDKKYDINYNDYKILFENKYGKLIKKKS
ncbi:MAG: hypothetical protein IKJ43_03575 [Bacilli bacterium]|nr:hypothetical protein [Bacilli bacterium]